MPKHIIRKDLSALGFYMVLYVILVNVVAGILAGGVALLGFLGYLFESDFPQPLTRFLYWISTKSGTTWYTLILNAVSQYLIAMPVMARIIRRRLPTIAVRQYLPAYYEMERAMPAEEEMPFRFRDIFALVLIIIFLMAAGSVIGSGIAALLGDAAGVEAANSQVELLLSGNIWATLLFVVVLAPLAEELFFRKLFIDRISPLGRRGAVLVSAVSFALFHQNFFQFFYAAFIGALFAIIYLKTEKILYTILLHAGVNLFGGVLMPYATGALDEIDPAALSPENTEAVMRLMQEHAGTVVFLCIYGLFVIVGLALFFVYIAKGKFRLTEAPGTAPGRIFTSAYCTAPGQIVFALVCVGLALFTLFVGLG